MGMCGVAAPPSLGLGQQVWVDRAPLFFSPLDSGRPDLTGGVKFHIDYTVARGQPFFFLFDYKTE